MQLFSPAQLILVLWLIAAAAPVATVLINGAMVPIEAAHRCDVTPQSDSGVELTASDAPAPWFIDDTGIVIACADREIIFEWTGRHSSEVPANSVLQTALQRHRPKSA